MMDSDGLQSTIPSGHGQGRGIGGSLVLGESDETQGGDRWHRALDLLIAQIRPNLIVNRLRIMCSVDSSFDDRRAVRRESLS